MGRRARGALIVLRRIVRRRTVLALGAATLVAGAFACVDLFHGTDFKTLCDDDAAACGPIDGGNPHGEGGDVDAAKPLIDFCTYSPAEAMHHARRACAWLGACEGPLQESVFGPCMLRALYMYDCTLNPVMRPHGRVHQIWSCLADVKSCKEVDQCVFPGPAPMCGGGPFTSCSDPDGGGVGGGSGSLVECANMGARGAGVFPCALVGQNCAKTGESNALCAGSRRTNCKGPRCDGTNVTDCQSFDTVNADFGFDCASFGGASCVAEDGGPLAACAPQPDAGTCEDAGMAVTCKEDEAGVATSCVNGKAVAIRCSNPNLKLPCDVANKPVPSYDPYRACLDVTGITRCAGPDQCEGGGAALTSCGRGATFRVTCADVNLGPCKLPSGGLAGACSPPPP